MAGERAGLAAPRGEPARVELAPSAEALVALGFLSPGEVPEPDFAAAGPVEPIVDDPLPAPTAPMTRTELVARAEAVGATVVIATPLAEDLDWTSIRPIEFVVRLTLAGELRVDERVAVNRQRDVRAARCACALLHVHARTDYVLALRPAVASDAWEVVDNDALSNAWGPVEVGDDGALIAEFSSGQRLNLGAVSLDWRAR